MITDEAIALGQVIPKDHCVRVRELGAWMTVDEYDRYTRRPLGAFIEGNLTLSVRRFIHQIRDEKGES